MFFVLGCFPTKAQRGTKTGKRMSWHEFVVTPFPRHQITRSALCPDAHKSVCHLENPRLLQGGLALEIQNRMEATKANETETSNEMDSKKRLSERFVTEHCQLTLQSIRECCDLVEEICETDGVKKAVHLQQMGIILAAFEELSQEIASGSVFISLPLLWE